MRMIRRSNGVVLRCFPRRECNAAVPAALHATAKSGELILLHPVVVLHRVVLHLVFLGLGLSLLLVGLLVLLHLILLHGVWLHLVLFHVVMLHVVLRHGRTGLRQCGERHGHDSHDQQTRNRLLHNSSRVLDVHQPNGQWEVRCMASRKVTKPGTIPAAMESTPGAGAAVSRSTAEPVLVAFDFILSENDSENDDAMDCQTGRRLEDARARRRSARPESEGPRGCVTGPGTAAGEARDRGS